MHAKELKDWNETRFQMPSRVIDALTYDQKVGMRTAMVAEYLSRTSRKEIAALMRRRRSSARKAGKSRTDR